MIRIERGPRGSRRQAASALLYTACGARNQLWLITSGRGPSECPRHRRRRLRRGGECEISVPPRLRRLRPPLPGSSVRPPWPRSVRRTPRPPWTSLGAGAAESAAATGRTLPSARPLAVCREHRSLLPLRPFRRPRVRCRRRWRWRPSETSSLAARRLRRLRLLRQLCSQRLSARVGAGGESPRGGAGAGRRRTRVSRQAGVAFSAARF